MLNGDLESWDDANTPTSWDKAENISQDMIEIHGGTYVAAHESASGTQDFQQNVSGIVGGQNYTISYFYKDNDPMARTRIWSYWTAAGNTIADNEDVLRPGEYSEDNPDWQEFSETLPAPVGADGFRFEVRVYKQDGMTGGHVYYDDFSIVGDQNVYPEPTNYPTAFTATTESVSIDLDWTDAVGEQLPSAYVILAEEWFGRDGEVEIPEDGTPIPNDFDFSDGEGAANVMYGVETFTFAGLSPSTGYRFHIYPYTNAGANIDYKNDGEAPTATAVTESIIILNQEGFENDLGTWTQFSVTGDQEWYQDVYNERTFAKMSGYAGGAIENEDWLISPEMDWTNFNELHFKFESAKGYDGNNLQLFLSQDYDGSSNPNDFSWTEITDNFMWADSWDFVASGDGDLVMYDYPKAYLAFMYTCTSVESPTWQVDDLMVYGKKTEGIGDNIIKLVKLYPNPASDNVTLELEETATVQIVNINGQVLHSEAFKSGQNLIRTADFVMGVYFLQIRYEDGSILNKKLVIE